MSKILVGTDFRFEPKVWSEHAKAYFDQRLVYGAFALRNDELEQEGTGLTVNFPYYNTIGPAEEPAENESLTPDNLTDDSFPATIFEAGKAVGITKKSFKKSADRVAGIVTEAQRQMARVMAEKVDRKLNNEITAYEGSTLDEDTDLTNVDGTDANYQNMLIGYKAAAAADNMTVRVLAEAKTRVFGDKAEQAVVCFMHSLQWLDSRLDKAAGFLQADANEPYSAINGFVGTLLGMAIVVTDTVKKLDTQIGNTDAYLAHFHKVNPYGIIEKQDMEMDDDYDILARQFLFTANQWYGVKSFDRKIHSLDNKSGGIITTVSKALVRE